MKVCVAIVFALFAFPDFVQNVDSTSYFTNKAGITKSIESKENKNIGLSHITSNIITFEQLLRCKEVTIEGKPEVDIVSYDIMCLMPTDGDIEVHSIIGNKIPDELIQTIIAEGINKILIENIIAMDHSENVSLGFRYFDLK